MATAFLLKSVMQFVLCESFCGLVFVPEPASRELSRPVSGSRSDASLP